MIEKLKIKMIYNDFLDSVNLSDEQITILDMMIKRETRYKISTVIGTSERTVGYEIQKIKKLYKDYCEYKLLLANLLGK